MSGSDEFIKKGWISIEHPAVKKWADEISTFASKTTGEGGLLAALEEAEGEKISRLNVGSVLRRKRDDDLDTIIVKVGARQWLMVQSPFPHLVGSMCSDAGVQGDLDAGYIVIDYKAEKEEA